MALDHTNDGKRVNDFALYPYRENPDGLVKWRVLYLVGPNKPHNIYNAAIDETSYGCAESSDLHEWDILPRAFGTSSNRKAFDGCAIWTMSIVDREEILQSPHFVHSETDIPFHYRLMYYTGVDAGQVQRIGLASYNYIDGEKRPKWVRLNENSPILDADDRYYVTSGRMAWRDPYVIYDKDADYKGEKGCFLMFVAAKDKTLPAQSNGCIALAKSHDLVNWTCEKPVLSPGMFDEMECPVPFRLGGRCYMLSSITDPNRPEDSLRVHYWMADSFTGEYRYMGPITDTCHYAARVIDDGRGNCVMLHTEWEDVADENDTVHRSRGQRISDPRIVTQHKDGRLELEPHIAKNIEKSTFGLSPLRFYKE